MNRKEKKLKKSVFIHLNKEEVFISISNILNHFNLPATTDIMASSSSENRKKENKWEHLQNHEKYRKVWVKLLSKRWCERTE